MQVPVLISDLVQRPLRFLPSATLLGGVVLGLAAQAFGSGDLATFRSLRSWVAIDEAMAKFSIFSAESFALPDSTILPRGGAVGSVENITLGNHMKLRGATRIVTKGNLILGNDCDSVPTIAVAKSMTSGSNNKFVDTLQVGREWGPFSIDQMYRAPDKDSALRFFASAGDGLHFNVAAIENRLSLSGNNLVVRGDFRFKGAFNAPNLTINPPGRFLMAAASGGPGSGQVLYGQAYEPFKTISIDVRNAINLPGYETVFDTTGENPDLDLSGGPKSGDTPVQFLAPTPSNPQNLGNANYWNCSQSALPPESCHGDTLLPGHYGDLKMAGNNRALLLTEGFYAFRNIFVTGPGNAIVSAQPSGGRTTLFAAKKIDVLGTNGFIGPDAARLATGVGGGAGQFLGGAMLIVASDFALTPNADLPLAFGLPSVPVIRVGNNNRVWASLLSATGSVVVGRPLALFGQIIARKVVCDSAVDLSAGGYAPFHPNSPLLSGKPFVVSEKADPALLAACGRPCRDGWDTLLLAYPSASLATVRYKVIESAQRGATENVDFVRDSGVVRFEPGQTMARIRIRVYDDSNYEAPESLRVVLTDPTAAFFDPSRLSRLSDAVPPNPPLASLQLNGVILDDDLPPLVRVVANSGAFEDSSAMHPVAFQVRLYDPVALDKPLAPQNAPQFPVPFWWSTADGSATLANADYVAQPGRWDTIPAGAVATTITVAAVPDSRFEADEFFQVRIDSLRNGVLAAAINDSGWIRNDDAAPEVTIAGGTVDEPTGYGDTAWAVFKLRLSQPSTLATTVRWSTRDSSAHGTRGVASSGLDYRMDSGVVVFEPDSVERTVRIAVLGDTLFEKFEAFKVVLDSLHNAVVAKAYGVATILDADSAPKVTIFDATVREPDSGMAELVLRVHLARPSALPASLVWTTVDGSAVGNLDYQKMSDTLRILAGVRDTVIRVRVRADSVAGEGSEALQVVLSGLVDLRADKLAATGTIADAQTGFKLVLDSVPVVAEADSVVRFGVRLNWIPAGALRVWYHTVAGTARAGERYADTSGVFVLPARSRFGSIAVRLTVDSVWEPREYFELHIDSVTGPLPVGFDSTARAWVQEPKNLGLGFDSPDTAVREDRAEFVFGTIRLSQPASVPVKIRLPLRLSSTAAVGSDFRYSGRGDTLVIPAGSRTWQFAVAVVSDTLVEADEVVRLGLVPLAAGAAGSGSWNLTILDDDRAAQVRLLTPPDGLHTREPLQHLTWTFDGQPQPTRDTVLPTSGWHCLEQRALDRFGRLASDTNCIWLDLVAPVVRVFKITGSSFRDRLVDTTWWGDSSQSRTGKDTVWYAVRDSVLAADGIHSRVAVDTFFRVAGMMGSGRHPTSVSVCDSVGNCGWDTAWIDFAPLLPQARSGAYLDRDGDGRIDAVLVELSGPWYATKFPQFDLELAPETRQGVQIDSLAYWSVSGVRDWSRFMVPIAEPFAVARTGFDRAQGLMWKWDTSGLAVADTFVIRDSIAPVITKTQLRLGELDAQRDTLIITASEPLALGGAVWLQVGTCSNGGKRCDASDLVWARLKVDSTWPLGQNHYGFLVPSASSGALRPGDWLRASGIADVFGNRLDTAKLGWMVAVGSGTIARAVGGAYLDRDGDGRIDAMIVELSGAWYANQLPTFDAPLPPEWRRGLRVDSIATNRLAAGGRDWSRLEVTLAEPFRFGQTGFEPVQALMWKLDSNGVAQADTFALRDSVAPVITNAQIRRVENYADPDTLVVTASERLVLAGQDWLQVGECPNGQVGCDTTALVWRTVPAESAQRLEDGRYEFLVATGTMGSIQPGDRLRLLGGVSDAAGNHEELENIHWAAFVDGGARPEYVRVTVPSEIPRIPLGEQGRRATGGVLLRASRGRIGGAPDLAWWEPGTGYVGDKTAAVASTCPELRFCNGPILHINHPVRMIVYVYDNSGTYVANRTIEITQADLDKMSPDQIDRLTIQLEWNHRDQRGKVVAGGVYVWRIVSYVKLAGVVKPLMQQQRFKLGVDVQQQH